ncbi:hypothetical protein H8D83_01945 [Candidatus Woesearchaeota archaeon]|nr:hypothetical protein [Candidatus Woesearchaeota archaeon]MBL7051023.1 hypothetical protein [Candidatus Woesearchaeota archaeon]
MEKDKKNIEDLLSISPACGNCNNSRKEYLIHNLIKKYSTEKLYGKPVAKVLDFIGVDDYEISLKRGLKDITKTINTFEINQKKINDKLNDEKELKDQNLERIKRYRAFRDFMDKTYEQTLSIKEEFEYLLELNKITKNNVIY